MNIVMNVRQDF